MVRDDPARRLAAALDEHQRLHDPALEPRNALPRLPELRRWQAARLARSFGPLLEDPSTRPAAEFFLTDLYGDHDFSRRDADVARVAPMMQRLLPRPLVATVADAVELAALSHRLDLAVAAALDRVLPAGAGIDEAAYAEAYREAGTRPLRGRQIDLIASAGAGLAQAMRIPGVRALLRLSRGPARALGVEALQEFLERGHAAFSRVRDADAFVARIERGEREVSRRLFAGMPDPFAPA